MPSVICVEHPLVKHRLSRLRDKETQPGEFRSLMREVAVFLSYEASRDLPLVEKSIETPNERMPAPFISAAAPVVASVLRAGDGLLQGMLDLFPAASVAHIGLYRDHETLRPVEYYFKAPASLSGRPVFLVDPMLATGYSAIEACKGLKRRGATDIRFVCLLAAPEGLSAFCREHPDVPVVTAAIDRELNDAGYIVPGLGDAGDRLFGTG